MTEGSYEYNRFEGIWQSPNCEKVYLMRGGGGTVYKIGISVNPQQRLVDLKDSGYPFKIELVATYSTIKAREIEGIFHKDFNYIRANFQGFPGFSPQGSTEWFLLPKIFEDRFGLACEEKEKFLIKHHKYIPSNIRVRMRNFSLDATRIETCLYD